MELRGFTGIRSQGCRKALGEALEQALHPLNIASDLRFGVKKGLGSWKLGLRCLRLGAWASGKLKNLLIIRIRFAGI